MHARELILAASVIAALLGVPGTVAAQCARNAFLSIGSSAVATAAGQAPERPQTAPSAGDWSVRLTEAQILALPVTTIVTATEWTPISRFEGPLLSDVLDLAGARGKTLNVFALNNYAVTIPWSDLIRYAPILAHTQDGARMKRNRFGPLFIVYPRDQYPALQAPSMMARMAWQVCRIDVE
ncbi:oxidoreductase [Variovorax paradoxus]|nr:oxidoreductase [Variovorax paradoxus]MBT2304014.1 oxidoreductase [Variovorax paradoxus]